jgi:ketosteroid isomerase-like protein
LENLEAVRELHAADEAGRLRRDPLFELLDEDVEWQALGPSELFAWAGTHRGHDGVRRWFDALNEAMAYERFELLELYSDGDTVVEIIAAAGHARATGRPFTSGRTTTPTPMRPRSTKGWRPSSDGTPEPPTFTEGSPHRLPGELTLLLEGEDRLPVPCGPTSSCAFWADCDGTGMEQRGRSRWRTISTPAARKRLDLARSSCHRLPPVATWIAW